MARYRRGGGREKLIVLGAGAVILAGSHHAAARQGAAASAAGVPPASSAVTAGGTLGCPGLEQLWEQAGGSPSAAEQAASVAMAESGGDQYASSPAGDVGYWQINEPIWGSALATTDPIGNAKAAIRISQDGADWTPWVTYDNGLTAGRC